jgi:hypothetical protein
LGKTAPALLRAHGWLIHLIADHFPDDAQKIDDPECIEYGLSRGWSLLTQDERIRRQPAALAPLRRYQGMIFCLATADLLAEAKADWFHRRQGAIYDRVRAGRAGFFLVHDYKLARRRI